ncbi:MAG: PP0621 family protein [Gammaproteobacteria bacterium]
MSRLLLILAIAGVAYYLYRRLTAGNSSSGGDRPAATRAADAPPVKRCAECGVHAPEEGGVHYQNLFFCSPEHLQAYLSKGGPG